MKKLLLSAYLLALIFSSQKSSAQTGWKWGFQSVIENPTLNFIESWQTATDTFGNVFTAGYTNGGEDSTVFGAAFTIYNVNHEFQQFTIKSDSSGNILWVKATNRSSMPVSMAADASGNLYVLGVFNEFSCTIDTVTLSDPHDYYMQYLVKFSPTGSVLWAKIVAPSRDTVGYYLAYTYGGVGVDGAGNVYVAGSFNLPVVSIGSYTLVNTNPIWAADGDGESYLAKYDPSGNVMWATSFKSYNTDYPNAMSVTKNGDVYVHGIYSHTIRIGSTSLAGATNYLTKYDSNGNEIWAENIDSNTIINNLTTDDAENIYLTGSIKANVVLGPDTLIDAGIQNMFVAKYNSSGSVLWGRAAGGTGTDIGYGVSIDYCGNLWISGGMGGVFITGYSMNFFGHVLHQPSGSSPDPMFIAEYDNLGNYQYSMALGSGGDDQSNIVTDNKGNFYLGADLSGGATGRDTLIFGADTLIATTEELFLAKYKYSLTGCRDLSGVTPVSPVTGVIVYPNPVSGQLFIEHAGKGTIIRLFNLPGKQVYEGIITNEKEEISTGSLASGIYLLQLTDNNGNRTVKKVVKE